MVYCVSSKSYLSYQSLQSWNILDRVIKRTDLLMARQSRARLSLDTQLQLAGNRTLVRRVQRVGRTLPDHYVSVVLWEVILELNQKKIEGKVHTFTRYSRRTEQVDFMFYMFEVCSLQWRHMASQITGVSIICSTACTGTDQRKHQSCATLAFVRGVQRWPVNSSHERPITRKLFPFDDVIMLLLSKVVCVDSALCLYVYIYAYIYIYPLNQVL